MEPFKDIEKYCQTVCNQIRWKRAKEFVSKEIENHLVDQRDAYIFDGDEENFATEKAIMQMGDPISIGEELDKTHKPKPQWGMLAIVGVMILIGALANYYISTDSRYMGNPANANFSIIPYILALVLLVSCYMADFRIFAKYPKILYGIVLAISIIGLMSENEINGQKVWVVWSFVIAIPQLNLIYPLVYALFIYSMKSKGLKGIFYCGLAYLPFIVILLITPTFSGMFFYSIISVTLLCFTINRGWFGCNKNIGLMVVLIPTVCGFIASVQTLVFGSAFRAERFRVLINPEQNDSYVYTRTQEMIKGSKFIGEGVLSEEWVSSFGYFPDYSLTDLTFRFGFLLTYIIIALVFLFAVIGISKALKEKSMLGSLVTLSIILIFTLQAVLYILGSLGRGYIGSFTLPFIAKGNVALCINAALIGFMLSVFRTGEIFMDYSKFSKNNDFKINTKRVVYENGKLIVNFK